jgi:hypothetical protein
MSDPQSEGAAPPRDTQSSDAVEPERPFHARRLLSLSAQRRRPAPAADERPAPERHRDPSTGSGQADAEHRREGARESGNGHATAPDDRLDPMARALALLSGIDDEARAAAQRASEEAARVKPQPQPLRSEGAAPRRPSRPLYTLQEVHERTGIPYATLALYAARHADRVPWLGERRSPAYPREGLEELCRIHAEANPGWQPPELGAERGWDDLHGLAARLDSLAGIQARLSEEVGRALAEARRAWHGEAIWVE